MTAQIKTLEWANNLNGKNIWPASSSLLIRNKPITMHVTFKYIYGGDNQNIKNAKGWPGGLWNTTVFIIITYPIVSAPFLSLLYPSISLEIILHSYHIDTRIWLKPVRWSSHQVNVSFYPPCVGRWWLC